MRLSQSDLADLLDVTQAAVSQATKEGYKVEGYPVRAWAIFDGSGRVSGYDVPKRVFERSNPSVPAETQNGRRTGLPGDFMGVASAGLELMEGTTWPEAVNQNATPVAGTAGGTITSYKFLEVLDNHPEILSSYMLDLGFPLIAAAIGAYATTENTNYRMLKIGLFAIGGWATIRTVRAAVRRWEEENPESALRGKPLPEAQGDPSEQAPQSQADVGSRTREQDGSMQAVPEMGLNGSPSSTVGTH